MIKLIKMLFTQHQHNTVINRLMLSVKLGPKVITLNSAHCNLFLIVTISSSPTTTNISLNFRRSSPLCPTSTFITSSRAWSGQKSKFTFSTLISISISILMTDGKKIVFAEYDLKILYQWDY